MKILYGIYFIFGMYVNDEYWYISIKLNFVNKKTISWLSGQKLEILDRLETTQMYVIRKKIQKEDCKR